MITGEKGMNTIYTIELEGMHICFLGALSNKDIVVGNIRSDR